MLGTPALGIVLIGAAALNEGQRTDLAGQLFGKALPYAEWPECVEHAFGASATLRLEPDLGIASSFWPKPVWRENIAEGDVMLVRPSGGHLTVSRSASSVTIGPREAVLIAGSGPVGFLSDRVERLDVIRAATSRLVSFSPGPSELLHRISREHPGLQMLGLYSAALLRGLMPVRSADVRDLVEDHLLALFDHIVGRRDESVDPPMRPPAGRLQAIKADIELSLGRRDLTADVVARLQRVSARHVQQLFKADGSTFSTYVLGRRLDLARQLLSRADETRPVSEIAFEVGFGDISYFNRTFKRRFGRTPTELRVGPP